LYVAIVGPARFLQPLEECLGPILFRIVFGEQHHHTNAPHALAARAPQTATQPPRR